MKKKNILLKVLKVIIVVFACLGAFLSGFLLVGAIRLSINKDNETKEIVGADLSSKGQVHLNNGGYLYNLAEFSYRFAISPKRVDEFKNLQVNDYIIYNDLSSYLYANVNDMNMGQGNFVINGVTIGSMLGQVKSDSYYWYNGTLPTRGIDYVFYSTSSPDSNHVVFTLHVGFIKTSMAQIEDWTYTEVQTDNVDRTYFIYDNNLNGDPFGLRFEDITDYEHGWSDGYSYGWDLGYQNGYGVGSSGMTSNPFNLISNAFDSVASVLNIQVLPNLTLGVLIFAPIIISVIIVIVKMIKG